ncbi:hypothetical protein [Streptomyces subrutilus]|uniref:PKD domain-containing protein n=1 Tax=Streptomyces subrutilus TaxID=36818 RepID=A0A5P2UKD3_9ACTN|nr:hypothetical protein [Streptomyces subrutilus]QEU79588.1 hypothetical protein CP968_15745 [Streptomyces subrutilus]WSJ31179.1 hypothetical protein OG479_18900 [Streptomyces subrutilus]GGZ84951.1 hypothetical protein GCM10010371_51100 [Streptomyces subrutilus]
MSAVAVIAASVGFIPGAAHAAEPVAPPVAAPDAQLTKAAAANFKTYKSPAEKSVRSALPAAKNKGAAAPRAAGAAAGNPNLNMVLAATSTTAHGLEFVTDLISEDASLIVTVEWGDGTRDQRDAYGAGALHYTHTYAELGQYNIKVTVSDPANGVQVVNELPYGTAGSDFTPYTPTRILDTRNGTGAKAGKVGPSGTVGLKVGGNGGIPAGVTAVVLNVTVTNPTNSGFVTVFPDFGERPTTSNVNYEAGQTVPNQVIVPVGKNGYVDLANSSWGGSSIDLIADVTGYFTKSAASGYTPMTPVRFVDTREGLGTSRGQLAGQGTFSTKISNLRGVPAGIKAVALNVTVTNPKQYGHLTVFPSGQAAPDTSSLNFTAGQTIANSVIVPVGSDGKIGVRNGAWGGVDVIVDVVGYYSPASTGSFVPVSPFRRLDTRDRPSGAIPGGYYQPVVFSPDPSEDGISGFVLNATATNTANTGYLAVAPDPNSYEDYERGTVNPPDAPGSSTLNWTKGKTVPNLVQASAGQNGIVDFFNQSWEEWATTDLIVDVFGYYETN